MPNVAIQMERSRMNEKKEMIFILVDSAGEKRPWVPADTVYDLASEAPELTHLLRSQVKAYLYALRDERRLVLKFEHGKFACQTLARAEALKLLKSVTEESTDPPTDPAPEPEQNTKKKHRRDRTGIMNSFKKFLSEFVSLDEVSVAALQIEAGRRGFGDPVAVNSLIHYLRNHGFLVRNRRGIVKLLNPPAAAPNDAPSDREPQPDPPAEVQEVAVEAPMRETKTTWQKALELVREIAKNGEITTKAFVSEGVNRNMGTPSSLTQFIPRLLEKGFLTKIHKGKYKVVPDESPETASPADAAGASPAEDPSGEISPASLQPPQKTGPFETAASLLHSMNGERHEVTRALTQAARIATALRGIPEENWDKAIDLARELARAGR